MPVVRALLGIGDSVTAVPAGLLAPFSAAADPATGSLDHTGFVAALRGLVEANAGVSVAAPKAVPLRRLFSLVRAPTLVPWSRVRAAPMCCRAWAVVVSE